MKYQYSDSVQITPHFNAREFRCKCGKAHDFEVNPTLVDKLEKYAEFKKQRITLKKQADTLLSEKKSLEDELAAKEKQWNWLKKTMRHGRRSLI